MRWAYYNSWLLALQSTQPGMRWRDRRNSSAYKCPSNTAISKRNQWESWIIFSITAANSIHSDFNPNTRLIGPWSQLHLLLFLYEYSWVPISIYQVKYLSRGAKNEVRPREWIKIPALNYLNKKAEACANTFALAIGRYCTLESNYSILYRTKLC